MNDPRRLLQGGDGVIASDLVRLMISSAQAEEPSENSLEKALATAALGGAALGLTASGHAAAAGHAAASAKVGTAAATTALGSTTTAATGAAVGGAGLLGKGLIGKGLAGKVLGTAASSTVAKWIGVAAVSGVVALGASAKLGGLDQSRVDASNLEIKQGLRNSAATAQMHDSDTLQPPDNQQEVVPAPLTTEPSLERGSLESAKDEAPPEPSQLAKEIVLLDQAREALAAGQNAKVLERVQHFTASFPRAHLRPEALFLRMEAEHRLGRVADATSSARRLLKLAPKSPHAARARELLAAP